jgi:four helix bundle protein
MRYLLLNDIAAYKKAFALSNYVWDIVVKWDIFAKKTIGEQFVNAVDSMSANIAEGFGRFGKKDKVKFYRYSFGSTKEACDWNEKAEVRKLITAEQHDHILHELQEMPREINHLIEFTREKLKD